MTGRFLNGLGIEKMDNKYTIRSDLTGYVDKNYPAGSGAKGPVLQARGPTRAATSPSSGGGTAGARDRRVFAAGRVCGMVRVLLRVGAMAYKPD